MPVADLRAEQAEKLRALLQELIPANRFYTNKLNAVDIDADIPLDAFLARAPFTSKRELIEDQIAHPPFGSNLTYPIDRYTRFSQTSATSGKPMRWLDTTGSWEWMLGNWRRVFEEAGVEPGDRVFFAFSFGPFLGFWTAFEAAQKIGCLCIPGGGMRSAARLRVILDSSASVLCATPTYAIHLAEAAAEEQIPLSDCRIRKVIVAGEPGGSIPGTRRKIEQLWGGAQVIDHHGMTEIGPVSYSCRVKSDVLHVMESEYIAEVVDPATGATLRPGQVGELVLTNLGRAGSPLLRYRTGDIVQTSAEDRCACGTSDMALIGGILGRTDDMIVVRGVNVYPAAVEDVMRAVGGVAEFRVEITSVHSLTELSIEAEPEPAHASDATLAHRIETALRDALSLRIPVSTVAPGTLPRFEMKARRWVRRS